MQCTCNAHAMHMQTLSTPMCIVYPPCLPLGSPGMLRAEELASLRSLAERLAVQLQRAGPAPGVAKIMAAILIARDGHGARAACRLIPGVPDEGAHTFVGTLARRVGMLLSGAAIVEAAEVVETVAMDTSAAGSVVACSSIVELESAAVCSSAAGLLAASSLSASLVESFVAQPTATISSYTITSTTGIASTAIASTVSISTAANPNPNPHPYPYDDDDPYAGWYSDSGSSGLGAMDETYNYPADSEEAEMREAHMRAACHAADRQKRARTEISAADAIACAACAGQMPGWQPSDDEPMVSLISDYEIKRLRTIVRNEQGLLDLNLIPSSQLALSQHTLERNLDLQHRQLSRAVATAAIAHAIRDYYVEQFPGLDRQDDV